MNNIVVSHPRSGTHLVLNIINNGFINYDGKKYDLNLKIKHNKTIKTHNINNIDIENNKIIYVVRDVRDVLLSNFFFTPKNQQYVGENNDTIKKLIEQQITLEKIKYWKKHINTWFNFEDKILIVRYSSILNNYIKEKDRLEKYLGFEVSNSVPKLETGFVPRVGIVGDYKNYMSEEFSNYILDECVNEINKIKNIKK